MRLSLLIPNSVAMSFVVDLVNCLNVSQWYANDMHQIQRHVTKLQPTDVIRRVLKTDAADKESREPGTAVEGF